MQKSQDLPFEKGAGDGWYSSTSGSVYDFQTTFADRSDLYKSFATGLSRATSYKTYPAFVGQQMFSSTHNPRPRFNNCRNYKVKGVGLPVTYCNQAYNRTNYYYWAEMTRYSIPLGSSSLLAQPSDPSSYWGKCDAIQRRAWWSMQPRFEGEFSALNFIYELKDFKDIARHLLRISPSSVVDMVRNLKRKLTYAQRRVAEGSASSTLIRTANAATKTLAEIHLTKEFAVDPTIRDLTTLHGQLITLVKNVQQEFFDRGQDIQSTHYSELIEENASALAIGTGNAYWRGTGSYTKAVFTATMEYRYDYLLRPWFEALKRYYGLNVNASVVWNALPFSFVLDYFYKVGQAIDFMNTDPNVELRLNQYCESILTEANSGLCYVTDPRAAVLINGGVRLSEPDDPPRFGEIISGYSGTWYSRRVATPNKGTATPRLSLPSAKQQRNLVALVRAMW